MSVSYIVYFWDGFEWQESAEFLLREEAEIFAHSRFEKYEVATCYR